MHVLLFVRRGVVVAAQVQHTMRNVPRGLLLEGFAKLSVSFGGRIEIDIHFAVYDLGCIRERKREDIGIVVVVEVLAVELADQLMVATHDAYMPQRFSFAPHHTLYQGRYLLSINRPRGVLHRHVNPFLDSQ